MSPAPTERGGGTVLEGRYRVDGVLARGGMSVVHRGMDLRLERPVAVKVLDRALAEDPAFVRRFEREARAAARLAHPGIVAVHDQGRDADGTTFLILELVEGGTLRDVLREHRRLPPAMALTVVEQVVTALRVAHRRGLVHQDVKPENVLVSHEGAVKVADFGLVAAAWDAGGAEDPSEDGEMILGTVAYLSPEQVADGHADVRSDLYSAGIVLFELLTGAPPYDGGTPARVASRHLAEDVPPPSTRVGGIPRALDRLVVAMTRRDPEARPADADEFLTDARDVRVRAGLPVLAVHPPPVRTAVPPPPRPMRGTRLLDLREDDDPALADDDGDVDPEDDGDSDDPEARATSDAERVDDVDEAIERLERRRARTRSRRVLAAWLLLVVLASLAAGAAGWSLGAALLTSG